MASALAPITFGAGPWKGVRSTTDPFDDTPDFLVDASNCYIPDPAGGSGLYARPGALQVASELATAQQWGCGQYTHTALDGTQTTFVATGGKLYRLSADMTTQTDVTPASGFSRATGSRVFMTSFNDALIVLDQLNNPWYVTSANINAVPLVPVQIEYETAGTAWAPQHMTIYGGSLFFLFGGATIVWSEPGDQTTGYHQDNFDNVWSLVQTASTPIYAIWGTNTALLYFREQTIGTIAGAVGPNLQSTATHDALAYNTGTRAPASIAQYGDSIFFADTQGRPQMLRPGLPPEPIWLNMRALVDGSQTGFPIVNGTMACGAIEPTLNLYVVALSSTNPGSNDAPAFAAVFDAKTGMYVGQWTIHDDFGSRLAKTINSIAVVANTSTGGLYLLFNTGAAGVSGGDLWRLRGVPENIWTDTSLLNGNSLPVISATTQRLGYTADRVLKPDLATIITDTPTPCSVTSLATGTPLTIEGTPTPSTSQDGTYRLVCGLDAFGRGIQLTVSPTAATTQWSLQRVQLTASVFRAGPSDP